MSDGKQPYGLSWAGARKVVLEQLRNMPAGTGFVAITFPAGGEKTASVVGGLPVLEEAIRILSLARDRMRPGPGGLIIPGGLG